MQYMAFCSHNPYQNYQQLLFQADLMIVFRILCLIKSTEDCLVSCWFLSVACNVHLTANKVLPRRDGQGPSRERHNMTVVFRPQWVLSS